MNAAHPTLGQFNLDIYLNLAHGFAHLGLHQSHQCALCTVYYVVCLWCSYSRSAGKLKIPSKWHWRTSLVVQWLRIRLPMQRTWLQALVQEDPTCHGATKPVNHNYWARVPQLLKPTRLEPMLHNKPPQWEASARQRREIGRASCRERV